MNILGSHSPLHHSSLNSGKSRADRINAFVGFKVCFLSMFGVSAVIHIAQLWFHGRISREESHRIIHQQGQVDGYVFLSAEQERKFKKRFSFTLFFLTSRCSLLSRRLFLVRVSQSNPKAFVLTLCHHQKIKHFQILPVRTSLCLIIIRLITVTLRQQTKGHLKL